MAFFVLFVVRKVNGTVRCRKGQVKESSIIGLPNVLDGDLDVSSHIVETFSQGRLADLSWASWPGNGRS